MTPSFSFDPLGTDSTPLVQEKKTRCQLFHEHVSSINIDAKFHPQQINIVYDVTERTLVRNNISNAPHIA